MEGRFGFEWHEVIVWVSCVSWQQSELPVSSWSPEVPAVWSAVSAPSFQNHCSLAQSALKVQRA